MDRETIDRLSKASESAYKAYEAEPTPNHLHAYLKASEAVTDAIIHRMRLKDQQRTSNGF